MGRVDGSVLGHLGQCTRWRPVPGRGWRSAAPCPARAGAGHGARPLRRVALPHREIDAHPAGAVAGQGIAPLQLQSLEPQAPQGGGSCDQSRNSHRPGKSRDAPPPPGCDGPRIRRLRRALERCPSGASDGHGAGGQAKDRASRWRRRGRQLSRAWTDGSTGPGQGGRDNPARPSPAPPRWPGPEPRARCPRPV